MRVSNTVTATALLGLASAQSVHIVTVSTPAGAIIYTPNNIKAAVGDQIQWQFAGGNHSVTQADFDNPCTPIQLHEANKTGIWSGFMDVAALAHNGTVPTFTATLTTASPLWFYCAQDSHCQGGMAMVINEDTAANATRSLENFKTLAATIPQSLFPPNVTLGQDADAGLTDTAVGFAVPNAGSANSSSLQPPSSMSVLPTPTITGLTTPTGSAASSTDTPKKGVSSTVYVPAWTGLFSVVGALAML